MSIEDSYLIVNLNEKIKELQGMVKTLTEENTVLKKLTDKEGKKETK